jgi:hypothetical protein
MTGSQVKLLDEKFHILILFTEYCLDHHTYIYIYIWIRSVGHVTRMMEDEKCVPLRLEGLRARNHQEDQGVRGYF